MSATVEPKWYFYAPTTPPGGTNPTKITLPDNAALQLQGEITQSKPNRHKDEGFGIDVETFEGSAQFGFAGHN